MKVANKHKKAWLFLEDGSLFEGFGIGSFSEITGELVFNTSMTGYQEIITDPSYIGQIVLFTYTLIGNYGVNSEDIEAPVPQVEGIVVKELSNIADNFRAEDTLENYLIKHKLGGIQGIDTRAITRKIREQGSMKCLITTKKQSKSKLTERLKKVPAMEGRDCVKKVDFSRCAEIEKMLNMKVKNASTFSPIKIAVIDYGIKFSILQYLSEEGFLLKIFPPDITSKEIIKFKPDGVFLSNGPGDPAVLEEQIKCIRELLPKFPVFGICLGHQLLALAHGAKTYKLKFGHRGANHPVKDLGLDTIAITSQNHGFAVLKDSLENTDLEISHINLNDQTVEGVISKKYNAFSVQFHPEASPGPHDSLYLFKKFYDRI